MEREECRRSGGVNNWEGHAWDVDTGMQHNLCCANFISTVLAPIQPSLFVASCVTSCHVALHIREPGKRVTSPARHARDSNSMRNVYWSKLDRDQTQCFP